jgi:hypothetical protein
LKKPSGNPDVGTYDWTTVKTFQALEEIVFAGNFEGSFNSSWSPVQLKKPDRQGWKSWKLKIFCFVSAFFALPP